jgi:GTP-binding protein
VVVAVNKWDNLDVSKREFIKTELARKLAFLRFAKWHYVSALDGMGIGAMLGAIDKAYASAMVKMPTPKLTRIIGAAVLQHQPPHQ